ncbi:unnamed protein product [Ectocarpus sp. 12 AP-2014]
MPRSSNRSPSSWYDTGDGETCNISPLQVVNTLKRMGAPTSKIASVRTRSDMCRNITQALDHKCLKTWKFKAFLGSGAHGSTFSIKNKSGVVRAAKIVGVDPRPEIRAQRKMASIGVAPKVYDSCKLARGVWVLTMEQVDGSVQDLVGGHKSLSKKKLSNLFQEIVKTVEAMEEAGVSHGDLSLDNIGYVTRPDGSFRVILIDFGWSGRLVPMFDMTSLAQSLLFTKNEVNREYLYGKTHAYILKKHGFMLPESTEGFDSLFRDFQKRFVANLRQPL